MKQSIGVHIDFETRSMVDLKKSSTHAYACDPSTDAWCMAYAIGDGEVGLWKMGDPFPMVLSAIVNMNNLTNPAGQEFYFIAHNANFELTIWNNLMAPRYGWPILLPEYTYCTMAMAYAMSLPGSLEQAAMAVGLEERKDLEGRRLMMQMAVPRRIDAEGNPTWWDEPAKLERLYAYCKNDVIVERALEERLLPLKPKEREVWLLDQEINGRGVQVDTRSINKAVKVVEAEKERLDQRMREVTEGYVNSARDVMNLTEWLQMYKVPVGGVAKADVRMALELTFLEPEVREALTIRQEAAKSSTAKLTAMVSGASTDGRVRGCFQYHGAGTGRWAGRKLQLHNMPVPKLSQFEIETAIEYMDDPDMLQALFGSPMTVISNCLRGLITSEPGYDLIAADYANIEGRMLAWLAGEEWKLGAFRRYDKKEGPDLYLVAAGRIYNLDPKDCKPYRPVGKVAELALGYQGGVGAFQTMSRGYGVAMAPAYAVLRERATTENMKKGEALWKKYLQLTASRGEIPMPYEEFMASELTKQFWREGHPMIVQYWKDLEEAAKQAVRCPGQIFGAGPKDHREIRFKKSGSFLFMRLPSGRNITYPYPCIKETRPPWADAESTELRPALCYMGVDSVTKSWKLQIAYGGLIAENATQGGARDVLVEGMFQAETSDCPVVMHVHDEVVSEVAESDDITPEQYAEIIVPQGIDWVRGCPIVAEGWRGKRYRK